MIRSVVVLVSLGAVATRLIVACSNETCAETLTCPASPAESATGATEAGLVDAEPSVQDASTDVDGSNLDSGTETDATTDAPWEADTGPAEPLADAGGAEGGRLGYCESLSPAPAFCDDFDEHALPGEWAAVSDVGGTLSEDSTSFVSSPSSLLTHDDALQAGQPLDTALRTQLRLPAAPDTISFEVQLEPVSADLDACAATVVAALDFTDAANDRYTVQFTLVQQGLALGLRLEEQSGFADGASSYLSHPLADPLPLGTWTDVRMVVGRTAAMAATVHVSFNGAAELDTPLSITVDATTLQLTIGSSFETEPSGGWANRYDNVRLDLQ
jgi:hypothetical protein